MYGGPEGSFTFLLRHSLFCQGVHFSAKAFTSLLRRSIFYYCFSAKAFTFLLRRSILCCSFSAKVFNSLMLLLC